MKYILSLLIVLVCSLASAKELKARVGSKMFTENYILAEIFAQVLEREGYEVERKFGLGATGISFESISTEAIDILPEYTGTISQAILKKDLPTIKSINLELNKINLQISESLGFNNTYVFGALQKTLDKYGINKMSDLKNHLNIKLAINHEFIKRKDGLKSFESHYGFSFKNIHPMNHSLSYQALESEKVEMIHLYSTDAKIKKLKIVGIKDDLGFFPKYYAVILVHNNWVSNNPGAWGSLKEIQNSITEDEMIRLNAMVDLEKKSFSEAATSFLNKFYGENKVAKINNGFDLIKLTREHLFLVFVSLFASILIALPLGVLATRTDYLKQIILSSSGILQTIPSLALLCFLIPWLGIGNPPALVALFLYGLLPIVRNSFEGINQIDSRLILSAKSLGLNSIQRLIRIEIPMALPSIMAGIKTSAIINVGTATLASFIGAGGYGTPIVTGLALKDNSIMLYGAIPAALLAIVLHFAFELLDRLIIPKGLMI